AEKLEARTQQIARRRQVLRLGVYKALLKERIVEFMETFRLTNPYTEISIQEYDHYLEVQDALADGEIDQGLTLCPVVHPTLKYEILKTGDLSLILSKDHPAAFRKLPLKHLLETESWIELSRKVHPVYKEIEDR